MGGFIEPTLVELAKKQKKLDGKVCRICNARLAAGATKTAHQPGTTFRVFLDPDGNPFCLVLRSDDVPGP